METYVPSWIAPLVVGLIVVGVFIFWVLSQMQNLPIVNEGTGEKARFMRYLSCAAAICGAWTDTDNSGDACRSGEVLSQGLEYEGQTLTKGCKELCEELRDDTARNNKVIGEHYCGKNFAFQFTFKDYVNFTSLDIRNLYRFKNRVIHKSCYDCPGHVEMPPMILGLIPTGEAYRLVRYGPGEEFKAEGYLMTADSDCKNTGNTVLTGLIWLPNTFAQSNCQGVTNWDDGAKTYAFCEFYTDNSVWIWGGGPNDNDDTHKEKLWEWLFFTSCSDYLNWASSDYYCPQIFTLENNPVNNCPT